MNVNKKAVLPQGNRAMSAISALAQD